MKRIVLLLSMLLCVAALGFGLVSCSEDLDNLTLDAEGFDPVVEYGATVDFGTLYLVYGEGEDRVRIPVTEDMIDGDTSTDTVGRKNILVRYEGRLLRFSFDVKYCATFVMGDTVEKIYVGEDEVLTPPSPDAHAPLGMEFVGWSPAVPTELSDNATFTAQYAPSTEPPALQDLSASFGQTLGDLTLPSTAVGAWQFVSAPETSVGAIGQHSFAVRFIPSDPLALPIDGSVTVTVGKAKILFDDLVDRFVYDGGEKFPTYTVPEGVTVITLGERGIDAGRYEFTLLVDDDCYEGFYTGSYTIEKAAVTITLPDYALTFDEAKTFVPVTYTVSGLDEALLGKVTVLKPAITGGGSYPLSATVENAANIEVTVSGGTLTVSKSALALTPPTLASGVVAYYGDTLSSLALSAHGNGVWSWKDASLVINTAGEYTATAVFTPTNTAGYEMAELTVTFPVAKKQLPLSLTVGAPVYNGQAHTASLSIADGEYDALGLTVNIRYNGATEAIAAGVYTVTAEIVDDRYAGTATAQMTVAKATPSGVDFSTLFDDLIWSQSGHTLGEITLPAGYSWVNASTEVPDSNIGVAVGYPAIFTPADTQNYETVSGEFSVKLNRAPAQITGNAQHEFTYNAASYTLVGLYTGSHGESAIAFYDENGNLFDFATLKNVGSYTVVVVLPESTHYARAERTVTVTITSGEYPDKTPPTGLTGIFTYKLSSVILPSDPDGVWTWQNPDEVLDLVGNKTYAATFTPNDGGYKPFDAGIGLTIDPKPIPIPTATYEKPYNGQRQSAGALSGEGYTVIDNGGTIAGTYSVIYSLTGGNYVWEDGTTENKSVLCFTITQAPNGFTTAPALNKYEWKYDEDPATLNSFAASFGVPKVFLNGTQITEIPADLAVGEYTLVFTVEETPNYKGAQETVDFEIKPAELAVPTFSAFYNGAPQGATRPVGTTLYTITQNVSETDADIYDVTVTLINPNYVWLGVEGADAPTTFTIKQAKNEWKLPLPTVPNIAFGETPSPVATPLYGTVNADVEYKVKGADDSTYTFDIPEELGEYTARLTVEGNENYEGLTATCDFSINKATNRWEIEPSLDKLTWIYDTDAPIITNWGTPVFGDEVKATLNGEPYTAMPTEAGSYTLILYVEGTEDYARLEKSFVLIVTPIELEVPSFKAPYSGLPQGAVLPEGVVDYEIKTNVSRENVGTYDIVLSMTNGNYAWKNIKGTDAPTTFTIEKITTNDWEQKPTLRKNEWKFGEAVGTPSSVSVAFGKITMTLNGEPINTLPTEFDVGNYTLVFTVEESANYNCPSETLTFTVKRGEVKIPTYTVPYNGNPQGATLPEGAKYTIKQNVSETSANTYTVILSLSDPDNYTWVNEDGYVDGADTEASFIIEQAKNAWSPAPTLSKDSWKYDEAAGTVSNYVAKFGTPIMTLNGKVITALPTTLDVGDYTVVISVEGNANYEGLTETFTFTVKPAIVDISVVPVVRFETTYTGATQKAGASSGTGYTAVDVERTDAATYTVTYKLAANYIWSDETSADKSVDFVIKPAVPTVIFQEYTDAIYQNNLSFEGIATGLGGVALAGSFTANRPALSPTTSFFTPGAETTQSFTYTVTFTPDNGNYAAVSKEITVTLKAAAYIGSTYYGSIEDALYHAANGEVVRIILDNDNSNGIVIRSDCEVKEGVTLLLPYGAGASDYNVKNKDGHFEATLHDTAYGALAALSRTLLVRVADGVAVTVNGTLTVAGELSGGHGGSQYAGHTARYYAELQLGRDAELIVNGTLHAFGLITESEKGNGSQVTAQAGSSVYQPFVLRDFLGGSRLYYLYNSGKNTSTAYKRFIFINIHPLVEYQYGSSLVTCVNLFAGDKQNATTVTMLGSASGNVIQMAEGGYALAKYDKDTEVTKLDLYGGATLNDMKLTVKANSLLSATVKSSEFLFALSYHYNITLNRTETQTSATYSAEKQAFQMLPGCTLTVGEGVTFKVGKIIILDESYVDAGDTCPYPTGNPLLPGDVFEGAKLTVLGSFSASALGGVVYTNDPANISITTKSFSSKDLYTAATGGLSGSFQTTRTLTAKLVGVGTVATFDGTDGTVDLEWGFAIADEEGKLTLPSAERTYYVLEGWYTADGVRLGGAGDVCTIEESRTIYARWTETHYTVSFNGNGGTPDSSSLVVEVGQALTLPGGTLQNYAIEGWYNAAGDRVGGAGESYVPTAYETLTARWTKTHYVITFDGIDGVPEVPTITVPVGEALTLPSGTLANYVLEGWYNADGVRVGGAGDSYTPADYETLTARWTKTDYVITFDGAEGVPEVPTITVPVGEALTLPSGTLANYVLEGWYNADGVRVGGAGDSYTPADYETLTARWTKTHYVVTFAPNGGNCDQTSVSVLIGEGIALPSASRTNYAFAGWFTAAEGGEKIEGEYTPTGDVTLYAQWTVTDYVITLNGNGGTADPGSLTVAVGGSVTLPTPTRTNHAFVGWFTAAEGGEKIEGEYTPADNVTLYAQWTRTHYTVTYNPNSGKVDPTSHTVEVGGSVTLPTPTRSSYTFKGWYTASSGGTKIGDAKASYTPTEDITLYAQWDYSGCVTGDTLVTLADGSKKEIKDLTESDLLLVWNFFAGRYEAVPAAILFNHGYADNTVIALSFSDGTVVKVVNLHQFLLADENRFVTIDEETVASYVGHAFVKQSGDGYTAVTLVDYEITKEYTVAYGIITACHYNVLIEGMFSTDFMPEDFDLFNYFEIGDGMRYDEEKIAEDIATYGLYTYEEFADYLTEEQFAAFNVQYMKIAVGKGHYTYEGILALIASYLG